MSEEDEKDRIIRCLISISNNLLKEQVTPVKVTILSMLENKHTLVIEHCVVVVHRSY